MEVVANNGVAEYFSFKSGLVFYVCLAVVFSAFTLAFFLALFKRNYTLKKRIYFSIFSFGTCLILLGYQVVVSSSIGYAVTLLGCSVAFSAIIFSIRVREKTKKQERDFIKFIDEQISAQKENPKLADLTCKIKQPIIEEEKAKTQTEKELINSSVDEKENSSKKNLALDVDFTHVKKVMERLSYVSLSPTDKRQIKELESAICAAECGQTDNLNKAKINDGLSALLKIMAKYGI